jgi:hypothetical protein
MNYKKNELNKMKKYDILEIIKTKTNISIIGKNTKNILIQKLLEFQKQQSQKSNTPSREKQKKPKKKRGRRAKSELNIESIMAQKNTFKENKNADPNIIVHLSGVTLDNIKELKKNNNPLKYNPVVNIPKETSSIKETNFAWINKKTKTPITSFSFLTKKNQKENNEYTKDTKDTKDKKDNLDKTEENIQEHNINSQHNNVDNLNNLEREFEHVKCIHEHNWYNETSVDTNMKEIVKEQIIEKRKKEPYNRVEKGRQNIIREMQYANRTNKWPESVSMCCAWCFHEFNTHPIAIPTKIVDDIVHLEDICCSLECAAAYIFCNEDGLFDDPLETYSLLHYVYQQTEQINPAPSRRTLKIRGGHYSIEEFRQLSANRNKTAKVVMPPFLSCIPIQEEVSTNIHINSAGITNMYIPVNKTRLDKASINIHEFRKKSSQVNNLGSYMNIVYK